MVSVSGIVVMVWFGVETSYLGTWTDRVWGFLTNAACFCLAGIVKGLLA